MQILVVYEKNYIRYFKPDINGFFLDSHIQIIKERLNEAWYEGKDWSIATSIVDDFDAHSDNLSSLGNRAERFLRKRSNFEYEDLEICDISN